MGWMLRNSGVDVERVAKFSQVRALSLGVRPTVDRRLSVFGVCRCFVVSYSLSLLFLLWSCAL